MDRNIIIDAKERGRKLSLSARRAWIEMSDVSLNYKEVSVALRKESVDRNNSGSPKKVAVVGRSPQGERG